MVEIGSGVQMDGAAQTTRLLVLEIDIAGRSYAIRAEQVQRVLPIAIWSPRAALPEHVVGILELEDQALYVVDARVCLGLEPRPPSIQDHLVLVQTGTAFLIWLERAVVLRDWQESDTLLNLEIFEPLIFEPLVNP